MSGKPKRPAGKPGQRADKGAPQPEEEPQPLDAEALLQAERARRVQAELEASQAALEGLAAEHAALQERRRHEAREEREVAALFRSEMNAKGEALAAAQAEAASGAAALAAAQAAAAQREAALHAAFDRERQALVVAAGELQARLDTLADWQRDKAAAAAETARLRQENARIAEQAGEKIRALQRRLYELDGGAEGEGGSHSGTGQGSSDGGGAGTEDGSAGGDLCLEADLHRLLAHSRKLADEMQHYGVEAEELQREMKALESERASLLRDAALAGEMEQQYAKRGSQQAREIKDQRSRIAALERGLARMAAEFEAEKAALETELRAQLADAVAEQNSLRRLLQVRTKELRQVRRLAQEVLLQRSEVEAFLVSSIQTVRREMAAEVAGRGGSSSSAAASGGPGAPAAAAQERSGAEQGSLQHVAPSSAASVADAGLEAGSPRSSASISMGSLGETASAVASEGTALSGASVGGDRVAAAGQMDIQQLGWQDRERILRLLFAKINKAGQRQAVPAVVRTQALSEAQAEAPPAPPLRGLATEAGPAGLA